jgi:hypothetical protein
MALALIASVPLALMWLTLRTPACRDVWTEARIQRAYANGDFKVET